MQAKHNDFPARSQNIFQTIKTGFLIWKHTFSQTIMLSLISAVLSGIPLWLYFIENIKQEKVFFIYLNILSNIVLLIISISMVYRINKSTHNEHITFSHAIIIGCRKVVPMLFVFILYFIMIKIDMPIISTVIIFTVFTFLPYLVIIDEHSMINAIKKSFRLVLGNYWYTLGVVLIITLMCVLICMVTTLLVIVGMLFLNYKCGIQINYFISTIIPVLLVIAIMIIIYPLLSACNIAALYNLQIRSKEKFNTNSLALS